MLWRQGDVLVQEIDVLPPDLRLQNRPIIASSRRTGHQHKIKRAGSARLYAAANDWRLMNMYLEVTEDEAELVHPEHATIVLKRGCYHVWRQREYAEGGNQYVID